MLAAEAGARKNFAAHAMLALRWLMTGSIGARRRISRLIYGVTRRLWPAV
jgi:hypothetical protein